MARMLRFGRRSSTTDFEGNRVEFLNQQSDVQGMAGTRKYWQETRTRLDAGAFSRERGIGK